MKKTMDEMLRRLHAMGDDDDVQLWLVIDEATTYLNLDEKKMTQAEAEKFWVVMSELITKMLQSGFIAVDLNGGRSYSYTAWPEQEPKQVLAQIRNKWVEYKGEFPNVGFIVWFHKVNKGPG